MVWLHGGAFVAGAGSQMIYKGRKLAVNGDMLVVTINYRLGAFGFLYLNDIADKTKNVSANNGLLDQIAALKWVKENIHAFGGDPEQITLFGESAGAFSIASLMACNEVEGLFSKAIIQSGSADHTLVKKEANKVTHRFMEILGIAKKDSDKLWNISAQEIVNAQQECLSMSVMRGVHRQPIHQFGMCFLPTIDGSLLTRAPISAIEQGAAKKIPLLLGVARDEWNLFLHTPTPTGRSLAKTKYRNLDKPGLIKICERDLPGLGEMSANLYEHHHLAEGKSSYLDMYSTFETDRMFRIPTIRIAEAQSQHNPKVYMYQLNWDKGLFKACHGLDIPFVFGDTQRGFGQLLTGGCTQSARLSETMQNSWISFARSADPSTEHTGNWPGYSPLKRGVMCFDENSGIVDDPMGKTREHWKGIL